MPQFECDHVCTWPERFWRANPKAKFYCGVCMTPRRIRRFPPMEQWTLWTELSWKEAGRVYYEGGVIGVIPVSDPEFPEISVSIIGESFEDEQRLIWDRY